MRPAFQVIAAAGLAVAGFGCVRLVHEKDLLPGVQFHASIPPSPLDIEMKAADGSILRGQAFVGKDRRIAIIYFGGNGEIVTAKSGLGEIALRDHVDLYALNYRGIGPSSGTASMDAIRADSLRVFDAIAARPDVRGHPIVVYGYSLGRLPALTVAVERSVAGVILQGAPSSAKEVVPKMRRALPWPACGLVRLRAAPEVAAYKPQPIDLAPQADGPSPFDPRHERHGHRDPVRPRAV